MQLFVYQYFYCSNGPKNSTVELFNILIFNHIRTSSLFRFYFPSLYNLNQVQRDQIPLMRYRALTIGMNTRPALR